MLHVPVELLIESRIGISRATGGRIAEPKASATRKNKMDIFADEECPDYGEGLEDDAEDLEYVQVLERVVAGRRMRACTRLRPK